MALKEDNLLLCVIQVDERAGGVHPALQLSFQPLETSYLTQARILYVLLTHCL